MNDYYRRLGMGPGAIEGEGEVLPLPVDLSSGERVRRVPVRGRVVSVGRLVAMKQYHGGVFRYLRNEKAAGRPASYVIIGDGPLRDALREQARRIGVADMVEFSGEVSYARLADYYQDPWCFVGMGTSAVEAASAGIPVVLANMLDTDGRSPGLLSTMPGFQLGDDLGLPTRPLEDLLAEVMGMSAAKYRTVVAAHRSHVARFTASEILAGMVELCLQAPEFLPQSIPGNWARRGSAVWRGIRRLAGRS